MRIKIVTDEDDIVDPGDKCTRGGRMRLIDADALKAYITKGYEEMKSEFKTDKYRGIAKLVTESFCMDIDEAPTIDAVPVKHGHWIEIEHGTVHGYCSNCGWKSHLYEDDVVGMPYCPNCGARMGEREDNANE